MDLILTLKAIAALSVIGLIASAALSVAARKFAVEVDPLVESVFNALPGANCGACGAPSCFSAAEAMVAEEMPVTGCTAGGQPVADAVAEALGVEACQLSSQIVVRHCGGGKAASRPFDYAGVMSCNAAVRVAGGDLACPSGCFGYGDCARVCPFDAITMDARGLPVVDSSKCTGCGVCIQECPRGRSGLLALVPTDAAVVVRCISHDKPKMRKDYCSMCCIACRKCEKACPSDAIHVVDRIAIIDYEKCTACGHCVTICPQECIDLAGVDWGAPARTLDGQGPKVEGFEPKGDSA